MFTGIIQQLGEVNRIEGFSNCRRVFIKPDAFWTEVKVGESIAINGVCLTIVKISPPLFAVEIVPATLSQTTLAGLRAGERVNLERALTPASSLSGHFVSGHIDGVGVIKRKGKDFFSIRLPSSLLGYLIPKGCIAIEGVSLTIAEIKGEEFIVHLIPYTLEHTNLRYKKEGDRVNVEIDFMLKAVYQYLRGFEEGRKGLREEVLWKAGFV